MSDKLLKQFKELKKKYLEPGASSDKHIGENWQACNFFAICLKIC